MSRAHISCLAALGLGAAVVGVGPNADEGEMPWHHPLYLDGGGHWSRRVAIEVRNLSERDLAGAVQQATVGPKDGHLPLVGAAVASLRVCDTEGQEVLYEVLATDDRPRHDGALQTGDRVLFAVGCPAGQARTYYAYAGNPRAWRVPDHLQAGLLNGGAEAGHDAPSAWRPVETDAQHRVAWVAEGPHAGTRCLKTVVEPGAQATWVKWQQADVPVRPGTDYVLRGWVRAQNAAGSVGWFIHVNGDEPMLINQVINAGEGTYDWRPIEFRFTAPPDAASATVGTVLYGTGTAWHDDVSLQPLGPQGDVEVRVGPLEGLDLAVPPATATWPDGADFRWPLDVINVAPAPRAKVLVRADARPILGRLQWRGEGWDLRVLSNGRRLRHHLLGSDLMFPAEIAPRSVVRYDLGAARTLRRQARPWASALSALAASEANLVGNASFEQGTNWPNQWRPPTEDPANAVIRGCRDRTDGDWVARLDIAPVAEADWQGWRQSVPVRPHTAYVYAARIKSQDLDGDARLHAHLRTAAGELVSSGAFLSTSPSIAGTTDWTYTSTTFTTPADAASVELHLTMNCHGTLWHDDVLLAEVVAATVGPMEARPTTGGKPGLRVWQMNALVKAFPDEPPGLQPEQITVRLARNEYEPCQLILRSERELRNVSVEITGPYTRRLFPGQVVINPVAFVPIDHPSAYYSSTLPAWRRLVPKGAGSSDGWAGEWPDPLMPNAPFDLQPNRAQPVWLTVHAPADAPPGEYLSHIRIEANGEQQATIPLRIVVWDFALPDESHCKAVYDLRSGPHGGVFEADDPGERLRDWYRFLAARRICPGDFRPEPRFEYRDGQVHVDTAEWDNTARYCLEDLHMSVFYTPWQFYALGWAHPPKPLFGLEPFTDTYDRAFRSMYAQFMGHLRQKGWHDKVVYYVSDEPDLTDEAVEQNLARVCRLAQSADPTVPIYSSTWRHKPAWNGLITQWGIGPHGSFPVDKMRERLAAGDQLWFTTDGHMCSDTPYLAIERLLPHLCFRYGVSGYEFWGVSWWTYDPWEQGWHTFIRQSHDGKTYRWVRYPNGDGFLTYPGDRFGRDHALSTIRLEQVREGLEDYEYLYMLKDLIAKTPKSDDRDVAESVLGEAQTLVTIPNEGGLRSTALMPDPDVVLMIRERVAEQITQLARFQ